MAQLTFLYWLNELRSKQFMVSYKTLLLSCILLVLSVADVQAQVPTSGLKLWLKADDLSLTDNAPVTSWNDASGLGNNFSLMGTGNPVYRVNGCPGVLNGKPYITWDTGVTPASLFIRNDVLGIAPNTARTFIAVYRLYNPSARSFVMQMGELGSSYLQYGFDANTWSTAGNKFGIYSMNSSYDANSTTDDQFHIQYVAANSMAIGTNIISDTEYRIDNSLQTLSQRSGGGTYLDFSTSNYITIGGYIEISEVIIYDHALNTTERGDVNTYLQTKYGSFPIAPPSLPTITSFTPDSSPSGTSVTITGANFTGATAVEFNGIAANAFTVNSSTSITATVPAGVTPGPISVSIGCYTGTSTNYFIPPYSPLGGIGTFNGTTDYVTIPDNPSLQPSNLTLSLWVKFTSLPSSGFGPLITKVLGSGINDSYVVWYLSGTLRAQVNDAALSISPVQINWTPTLNQWYHIAFTFNGTSKVQTLYLNGSAVATNVAPVSPQFDSSPVRIAADVDNGVTATAPVVVDEVRIWNSALTQAQLLNSFSTTLVGNEAGLVGYYKLDEAGQGSGITVTNSATTTGASLNGSTVGTASTPIFSTVANFVTIPDANFKTALISQGVDTNGNGEIEVSEAQTTTSLDVSGKSIQSLTGIEAFINLTSLNLQYNQLTSLNLSANTALQYLNCGGNQLTNLDVSANTALTYLRSNVNQLTSLDVSANIALGELWTDTNQLTSLNLGSNTVLYHLDAQNNKLTSLNVSANTALDQIGIWNNNIPIILTDGSVPIIYKDNITQVATFQSASATPGIVASQTGGFVLGSSGAIVNLTNNSSGAGNITTTTGANPTTFGALPSGVISVSPFKFWTINSNLTSATYNLILDVTPIASITNFNTLRVLKRANASSAWQNVAEAPINATVEYLQPFVLVSGLTDLSDFAIGLGNDNELIVTLTSFTPASGGIGATVILTGNNFDATPSNNLVKFNGTTAVVTSSTSTSITTIVPAGSTTGLIEVTVNGHTAISSTAFTLVAPPTITSFTPSSGIIGNSITIIGTNFSTTRANNVVKFNGTTAVVTASTATSITTIIPAGASTGLITVTVNGQTATSAAAFTVIPSPTITSFSPEFGEVGATIVIIGTNFDATPANNIVKFGGVAAVVTASTSTSITTTVPSGAVAGAITVTVNSQTGTSATGFYVGTPSPIITSFTPTTGAEGITVTINGVFFSNVPANNLVKFNGTATTVTTSTGTALTTTVPVGAVTGPITVTRGGLTATSTTSFTLGVSAADSLSLVAIHNATNGTSWKNKSNWLTAPIKTWYGVTVVNGKITSLALSSNKLINAIPVELASLDELTSIDLSGNQITSIPDLSSNTLLTSLNVTNNKLEFGSLESNVSITGITYSPQDSVDVTESVLKQLGASQTFIASISGTANAYQWKKNGTDLTGATNSSLTLANVTFKDDGVYTYASTSTKVPNLILLSKTKTLRVSSIQRDSIALRALYTKTNGGSWTNKANWLTTPLQTGNWFGVTITGNRVSGLTLPNNNLTGSVPQVVADVLNLNTLNLSHNKIQHLPDLQSLSGLSTLDVSNNQLDFASLIPNSKITGVNYVNQADIGTATKELIDVGNSYKLKVITDGVGNQYQWKRNGSAVAGAIDSTLQISALGRSNMGDYVSEITNPAVPGLVLKTATKTVLAVAVLSGKLKVSDTEAAKKGIVRLFKIQATGGYDTIQTKNVNEAGEYKFEKVILDDYQIQGFADTLSYARALPSYYKSTYLWEEADTLSVDNSRSDLDVLSAFKPLNVEKGVGRLSGIFYDVGAKAGKIERPGRVNGAGASVRKVENTARPLAEKLTLVAYVFTDENGEFVFPDLPKATYRLNLQYPGYPMDETSYITITIGDGLESQIRVAAQVEDNKIKVTKLVVTGLWEQEGYHAIVYPNPTSGFVQFKFEESSESRRIEFFDLSGRKMMNVEADEKERTVELKDLASGIYLIQIVDQNKLRKTARLVIERK